MKVRRELTIDLIHFVESFKRSIGIKGNFWVFSQNSMRSVLKHRSGLRSEENMCIFS